MLQCTRMSRVRGQAGSHSAQTQAPPKLAVARRGRKRVLRRSPSDTDELNSTLETKPVSKKVVNRSI